MERDDDRHLRRYAFECRPSRFDVNPVPEVVRRRARWKGIEGANPISRDLSKDWSVRTVKSSKQVVSGQRIDSFFFLSSVFRTDFQTFFVHREF